MQRYWAKTRPRPAHRHVHVARTSRGASWREAGWRAVAESRGKSAVALGLRPALGSIEAACLLRPAIYSRAAVEGPRVAERAVAARCAATVIPAAARAIPATVVPACSGVATTTRPGTPVIAASARGTAA